MNYSSLTIVRIQDIGSVNCKSDEYVCFSVRIYVGLPDLENRSKILKVLLKKENLESGFSFEQLAEATAGYSGSDLKVQYWDSYKLAMVIASCNLFMIWYLSSQNLCVSAAYRPIEELLREESKVRTRTVLWLY